MNILITGAAGFIGSALCSRLALDHKVIGVYHRSQRVNPENFVSEQADLIDGNAVAAICEKYSPDVVVHCAGIAHQKIGMVDPAAYMRVNSEATESLAKTAGKSNPDVCFVFLSSVCVYGEDPQITQIGQIGANNNAVGEGSKCQPSSDYAASKLDAERRLIALAEDGVINNLVILRLAPVYDRDWSFNLDRRVLAPMNMAYIRFGSGCQKMSALARPNLIDFVDFLIHRSSRYDLLDQPGRRGFSRADRNRYPQIAQINAENNMKKSRERQGNSSSLRIDILNVCDAEAYEFSTIIEVFRNSGIRPNLPVVRVPLFSVWLATRIAGSFLPHKRKWFHSCYEKLASDLVFDNKKMLKTGFMPRYCLETIFPPKINCRTSKHF